MEQWLEQLQNVLVSGTGADGLSVTEIVGRTGKGEKWVRSALRKAIALGLVKAAGTRPAARIDGSRCTVPVYQFINQTKKGKHAVK